MAATPLLFLFYEWKIKKIHIKNPPAIADGFDYSI
jgi:hypothetical protein